MHKISNKYSEESLTFCGIFEAKWKTISQGGVFLIQRLSDKLTDIAGRLLLSTIGLGLCVGAIYGAHEDDKRREKIAISCGIEPENIISAPDVENIYQIPLNFENQNLSDKILSKLSTKPRRSDLADWKVMVNRALTSRKTAKIAMVGKYF